MPVPSCNFPHCAACLFMIDTSAAALGVRLSAWKVLSIVYLEPTHLKTAAPEAESKKKTEGGRGGGDKGAVNWEHIHASLVKVLEKSKHHI